MAALRHLLTEDVTSSSKLLLRLPTAPKDIPTILCLCLFLFKMPCFHMFIFQCTRWLNAFMGDIQIMYRWPWHKGDEQQPQSPSLPVFFCWLNNLRTEEQKIYAVGKTPGRMADGDEIVGIQVNIAWFCSQSLVMFVSGKVNVRDFRQSRDSLPKGGFREGISNTLTTRFPPLLPGCQGASALPQDDLLKPW